MTWTILPSLGKILVRHKKSKQYFNAEVTIFEVGENEYKVSAIVIENTPMGFGFSRLREWEFVFNLKDANRLLEDYKKLIDKNFFKNK